MIISLYIGMTKRKNRDTTNCWWVCGQNNHSHIDAVMLNRTVTLENILAHSLKLTMQFLFNRSNCIPAKWKLCSHKILYTNVYGSINYNNRKRKQPRCMSLGEGLNKLWYIHTMNYYSVIKRDKLMIHVTTCMDLKTIMLSENQSQIIA